MSGRGPACARLVVAMIALGTVLMSCSGNGAGEGASRPPGTAGPSIGVPVRVAPVRMADLDRIVTAPGRTEALRRNRVRAPFAGHLISLSVTDGDKVSAGQEVAVLVSKDSEAALEGARQMLAAAASPSETDDAKRAIEVARRQLVRRTLRAPAAGTVLSHAAEEGDYLEEGEVLLTIAEAGAVFFVAQVGQGDLPRIAPGQRARIEIRALGESPLGAVVHGLLPTASSENLSAPVRLDFRPPRPELATGLFGGASIVTGTTAGALVVPAAAVLRDDVSGVSRVAVVDPAGRAHWHEVETGVRDGDRVEISGAGLDAGRYVIVQGQVGLPEGARVQIQP